MTISPPAKVKLTFNDTSKTLGSGIDSCDVSAYISWENESCFDYLHQMKALAVASESEVAIQFPGTDFYAMLKPYGRKGHQWIITNNDFELTLGDWLEPKSRPSAMIRIRSEALWRIGPKECVNLLREIFTKAGAKSLTIKPSRIDLCVDMTFPVSEWSVNLIPFRVTRSQYAAPHFCNALMTGISIGKGTIAARLYDKPLEIKQKSKKIWMYDIWGIEEDIPKNLKIIRTEGQFRREALKELGIDTIDDLFDHIEKLWGYFTQHWLKFADNPGNHHTMRKVLPWWEIIQNSFLGVQSPTPLIRCKAIHPLKRQLFAQTYGTLTSLLACSHEEQEVPIGCSAQLTDLVNQFQQSTNENGKSDFELEVDLMEKRAKRARVYAKMRDVHQQRKAQGLPSNIILPHHSGQKKWDSRN